MPPIRSLAQVCNEAIVMPCHIEKMAEVLYKNIVGFLDVDDVVNFAQSDKYIFHQIYIRYNISKITLTNNRQLVNCAMMHIYFTTNFVLEVLDLNMLTLFYKRYPKLYHQIKCVKFHDIFNGLLKEGVVWPNNMHKLIFGVNFNNRLENLHNNNYFPKSLEYIEFSVMFQSGNCPIKSYQYYGQTLNYPYLFLFGLNNIKTIVVGQCYKENVTDLDMPAYFPKLKNIIQNTFIDNSNRTFTPIQKVLYQRG